MAVPCWAAPAAASPSNWAPPAPPSTSPAGPPPAPCPPCSAPRPSTRPPSWSTAPAARHRRAGRPRLALAQAEELETHGITVIALTPGFLRSEAVLDHFGVTAQTWRDAIAKDPHFAASETPRYIGRAVACLAADPGKLAGTGTATASWELARRYGFTDTDGTTPDWGSYARENL